MRPATQALRARDERHELRIVLPALLQRPPGQIVKGLEIVARARFQCQLPAFACVATFHCHRSLDVTAGESDQKDEGETGGHRYE